MDAKALFQALDLPASQRRHRTVILAMDAFEQIPLRFRVANQVHCCHESFILSLNLITTE